MNADEDTLPAADLFALIEWRQATAEDINFVKKTWLTSLRLSMPRSIPSDVFYPKHEAIIGNIANDTPCWIACDKEHSFYVYGWACGVVSEEGVPLLHYIFVRPEYRRRGLAKALAGKIGWRGNKPFTVSHLTGFIKNRWMLNLTWDPYILGKYVQSK